MATALRAGVRHLETTAHISLLVLALASGVYTYLGVRDLLEGSATAVFFAAIIYSTAVSVGIYAFWTFLLRFLPHITETSSRLMMFGAMVLGSAMIVAMSSWLNASALAGSAAQEQHLGVTLGAYSRDLEQAHGNALAAQGLTPDIQLAAVRFAQLADSERSGSLTGTTGSGTVVQLLMQMSNQLTGLAKEVTASGARVQELYQQGATHLAAMRTLASGTGDVTPRADAFGTEATALSGVLVALQQASIAPAVKRIASDMSAGFIAPAADGRTPDIMGRQNEVVTRVQGAVAAQAKALASAADTVLKLPPVTPTRFEQISSAEAVLRYAGDFLPSWAGAISIDLLPAVLVLILCVVHGAIRREGEPTIAAQDMTAGQMMAALHMARDLEQARAASALPFPMPLPPAPVDAGSSTVAEGEDANVTALHGVRPVKRD